MVIRTEAIGDVFLASGAVPAIQKTHPDCEIVFCTRHQSILQNIPGVRCANAAQINKNEYEAVYDLDLCYELNPTISIFQSIANAVHTDVDEIRPRVFLSSAEVAAAKETLKKQGICENEIIVALQSSTGFWARNISDKVLNNIAGLFLENPSVRLIQLGSKDDMALRGVTDLRGILVLRESIAVLSLCSAFVGVDSSLLHIAKSFQIPSLSFWGAVHPVLRGRSNPRDLEVVSGIQCAFCHHRQSMPAFITVCYRQGSILFLLDKLWQRALRKKYMGTRPYFIRAGVLSRLLRFREKGKCIPLCMKWFEKKALPNNVIQWIHGILTNRSKPFNE
ncbi:glycosyltransferase family 9 protein [bacterium]|nr:glycosyltransferase family 9 protein [bacterium]